MSGKVSLEIHFVSGEKEKFIVDSSCGWWYQDGYLFVVVSDGKKDVMRHYELSNITQVIKRSGEVEN